MSSFSFSVKTWHLSTTHGTHNQLDLSGEQPLNKTAAQQLPPLQFIPSLQRRRLSLTTKLLFDCLWNISKEEKTMPIVFSSHNGELNRSISMYLDLLHNNSMSPTSFVLSVHNASASQWALFKQDMGEINAISAPHSIWAYAIAEGYTLLNEGHQEVLVIATEDQIKEEYRLDFPSPPLAYALAAIITPGQDWMLSTTHFPTSTPTNNYWDGINWVRNTLQNRQSWLEQTADFAWLWKRL